MTIQNEIKVEQIQELIKANKNAQEVFKVLSERERHRSSLNIDSFSMKLKDNNKHDVIALFKDLEHLGVGKYKKAWKEHPNYFFSRYSLKWLSDAALKGDEAGVPIKARNPLNRLTDHIKSPVVIRKKRIGDNKSIRVLLAQILTKLEAQEE